MMRREPGSHLGPDGTPKVYYPTRKVAKRAAKTITRAHDGQPMHSYPCSACGGFHLSSGVRRRLEP